MGRGDVFGFLFCFNYISWLETATFPWEPSAVTNKTFWHKMFLNKHEGIQGRKNILNSEKKETSAPPSFFSSSEGKGPMIKWPLAWPWGSRTWTVSWAAWERWCTQPGSSWPAPPGLRRTWSPPPGRPSQWCPSWCPDGDREEVAVRECADCHLFFVKEATRCRVT